MRELVYHQKFLTESSPRKLSILLPRLLADAPKRIESSRYTLETLLPMLLDTVKVLMETAESIRPEL